MNKLSILFVIDDNLLKSVVYDPHLIAEYLSKRGHNVNIVGSGRSNNNCFRFKQTLLNRVNEHSKAKYNNFLFIKIPIINFLVGLASSYKLIRNKIITEKPDAIILYSVLYTGLPTLFLGRKHCIPIIFRNIDMLHKLFRNPYKKLIIKILESLIYKKVSKSFALTNKYKQYLMQNGSKKENCSIVKFPVDLDLFLNPKDFPIYEKYKFIRSDTFKLFYLGYLYEFSALNEIIKKLPYLIKYIPNLQLIIAGEGPLLKDLQISVKKLKLEKNVCLLGHVDFKFIPYLLTKIDICINAYFISKEMKDLFSAKILQYMAAKKVIISLNQEFINDFKKDNKEGLVVVDSIDKLLSKVLYFYNNKSLLEKYGLKNFQIVAKEHDIKEILNQIEIELSNLIKKNTQI